MSSESVYIFTNFFALLLFPKEQGKHYTCKDRGQAQTPFTAGKAGRETTRVRGFAVFLCFETRAENRRRQKKNAGIRNASAMSHASGDAKHAAV